jgi:hypothetical protein
MTKKEMNAFIDAVAISDVKIFKCISDGIFHKKGIEVTRYSIILNGKHKTNYELPICDAFTKNQWIKYAQKNYLMQLISDNLPDMKSFEQNLKKDILKMVDVSDEKIMKIKNQAGIHIRYSCLIDGWFEHVDMLSNTKKTKKDLRIHAQCKYIIHCIYGHISPKTKRSTRISAQ